jgi:hypothetical protein
MRFGFGSSSRSGSSSASKPATPRAAPQLSIVPPKEPFRAAPAALVKRIPFEPKGDKVPVFFLHIPRTSGASLMSFLRRVYGADAVTEGAEDLASIILGGRHETVRTDCLTGILPLMRWQMYRGAEAYRRVTILRDPWARLVSQINRLAILGPDGAGPDGTVSRALASEVAAADFTSRPGLERFRRRLQPVEGGLDNLQTRMLLTGTMSAMVKPLTLRDVDKSLANLAEFSLVGFCEDQGTLQRGMLRLTEQTAALASLFESTGKAVALSPRNDLAREVLEPLFHYDQVLYTRAKAMIAARQP